MSGKKRSDPIVLSFYESLIRASDIQLLKGPHWLNDQIISFYFEYLEKVKYKNEPRMLFISPEVTQCLKICADEDVEVFLTPEAANDKSFIFFALNDNESAVAGGSHWSLVVFSKPDRAFFHFDSSCNANVHHFRDVVSKIRKALNCNKNFIIKSIKCLQQTNGYDCGIHVLCMADNIADNINRFENVIDAGQITHEIVSRKRAEILKIISQLGGNNNEI